MTAPKTGSHFGHALTMLLRNIRSYSMLSVTILLSFVLLLGYLCFTDAQLYNQYKEVFVPPKEITLAYSVGPNDVPTHVALTESIKKQDPDAVCYVYRELNATLVQYSKDLYADVTLLPAGGMPVYRTQITGSWHLVPWREKLVAGKENFSLSGNQVIISQELFEIMDPKGELPFSMVLPLQTGDGYLYYPVEVVGVCAPSGRDSTAVIYASQELVKSEDLSRLSVNRIYSWIYSKEAATAAFRAENLGLIAHSAAKAQSDALKEIRAQKATKGTMAMGLLLLLGVNLYSCFSNALNDRQFEIGVKRAIGARAGDIVRQFLTESLLVMLANILLTVLLVVNLLVLYKLYVFLSAGKLWVVYISGYTVAMFLVCALSLTLVFSLFFAYKSTKVEIVQYLKAE